MCQEVLTMVQKMNNKHIETKLAIQCAPLIAGIKISNLLIVSEQEAENLGQILRKTGLVFLKLAEVRDKVTFLLFRRQELCAYLEDPKVQQILSECGYEDMSFHGILCKFMERYQAYAREEEAFPHEMGFLLGYPIEDVTGFIEHNGKNFLYSGYFKVYADVAKKQELFRRYEEAQRNVIALLAQGIGIRRIIKGYNGGYQMKIAV